MNFLSRLVSSLAMVGYASLVASADLNTMSAEEAHHRSAAGEITLIDVRTPKEWEETGIPKHGVGISLQNPNFVEELRAVLAANPAKPIALICASGVRSAYAAKMLEKRGFSGLIEVKEGMKGSTAGPGWLDRTLPVREP